MQSHDTAASPKEILSDLYSGRAVTVHGSVLDVWYRDNALPAIGEAVAIAWDGAAPLVAEVQQHLDPATIRAVALKSTAGLKSGVAVRALGTTIRVPVGEAALERLLNVLGEPKDRRSALPPDIKRRPMHSAAPSMERRSRALEIFHTEIKVVNLLAPLLAGCRQASDFGHRLP